MFHKFFCYSLLPILFFISSSSLAEDNAALQKQLDELVQRVSILEDKLKMLDTPEVRGIIEKLSGPQNPGDSQDQSNWRLLSVGYDYQEVRELLGEPVRIKKGGMEFWYYSDQGLKGPYIKFLFRKVNDWQAPPKD